LEKKFTKLSKPQKKKFKKFLQTICSAMQNIEKRLQPKNCYRVLLSDPLSLVVMKGCTTGF